MNRTTGLDNNGDQDQGVRGGFIEMLIKDVLRASVELFITNSYK